MPSSIRQTVGEIAKEAGAFIKGELNALNPEDILVKDFNSLVSYVDIEAEKKIVSRLKELLPQASFHTEEGTVTDGRQRDYIWIIDPLDGTTNFMHQVPFFSVSIALQHQGNYILGVVYDVMHDNVFSAEKGQGAWMDENRIQVSPTTNLADAVLATGFPYNSFDQMESYLSLFRELFQSTRGIRRLGSAALDLCYVAKGSFAGFYEYGLNEWDIAAGICILIEAGGQVSDFNGSENFVQGKTILATNGHTHNELQTMLQKHF